MNTVHCKAPTRRQIKADIKARVLRNEHSLSAQMVRLEIQREESESVWNNFKALYSEAPYPGTPRDNYKSRGPSSVWYLNLGDAVTYFFRPGSLEKLRQAYFSNTALLEVERGLVAFKLFLAQRDRFLNTLPEVVRSCREQNLPYHDTYMSAEYMQLCDEHLVCGLDAWRWAGGSIEEHLQKFMSPVPARPAPEHPLDPAAKPSDLHVPVMISLAIGVVIACLVYWKFG